MPEGDTLYRTAENLRKALGGKTITRLDSVLPAVREVDSRKRVAGRFAQAVEARGKHLLVVLRKPESEFQIGEGDAIAVPDRLQMRLLRSDLVLHTHLRMTGSWHIYRPGEAWQKPVKYAKCVLYTEDFVFPCFSAPVVELMTAREAARHSQLVELGPDAITDEFDADAALANLRRYPEVEIGIALMNQRLMAGVGNVFKSEVMFIRRVSPWTKIADLADEELAGLIREGHELLKLNRMRGARRTHFGLDDRDLLWVYGRSGKACRACGSIIRMRRQGLDGRSTYYCPLCQAPKQQSTQAA